MSIWARGFWKSYWIALKRARRDKRARSFALRVTVLLTYPVAYVLFIWFTEVTTGAGGGMWRAVFYTFILGSGTIAAILMRRWHKKQDELLNFSLTGRSHLHPQDASDASPEVRTYLEERLLIVASLFARGASEIYLQHNQPAPGLEVDTRQIQNGLLREYGLWHKLERAEAEMASAADGLWTVEQQNHVLMWCEHLRLLRWTLRVDAELVSLAHVPKLDFSLSREILQRERITPSSKPVLKSWDVRVQRDAAMEYTARIVAELKARGLIAESPELEGWADEFRTKSLGASTDYLAGPRTIGELDDGALRRLGSFSAARERYADYLVDLLNSVQPFPFSLWAGGAVLRSKLTLSLLSPDTPN